MTDSHVWKSDRVAAANLCRAIGLGEDGIDIETQHMANYRASSFDMVLSRIRTTVLERIRRMISDHGHRSPEWSAGCRSAEEVLDFTLTPSFLGIADVRATTRGEILRKMVHDAKARRTGEYVATLMPSKQRD